MKKIAAILLSLTIGISSMGCMAAVVGGGIAVGGYYLGKYYQHKDEAYTQYVKDCQTKNIPPLPYDVWSRTEWKNAK